MFFGQPGKKYKNLLILFALIFLGFSFTSLEFNSRAATTGEFATGVKDRILDEYFPDKLVRRMKNDAKPIVERFYRINVFTSSQYGKNFVTGVVDIGDVFDARNPINRRIFKRYARDNLLILNPGEKKHYNRYALAATRFIRELGYDVVLFYPDEFHPVFTNLDDTWMFIREDPVGKPLAEDGYYYSGRIKNRQIAIKGGLSLEPLNLVRTPEFYVPVAGEKYEPYQLVKSRIVTESSRPEILNPYEGTNVTLRMRKKREHLGIIPSDLSGRKAVAVGSWFEESSAEKQVKVGFRFSGNERKYTWGDCGMYVIPLDREFWKY